jgi:putative transposase
LLEEKSESLEVPKRQRLVHRPSLRVLMPSTMKHDKSRRDQDIFKACVEYGYGLAEVGRFVDLHYATVSRIVRRAMSQDKT